MCSCFPGSALSLAGSAVNSLPGLYYPTLVVSSYSCVHFLCSLTSLLSDLSKLGVNVMYSKCL